MAHVQVQELFLKLKEWASHELLAHHAAQPSLHPLAAAHARASTHAEACRPSGCLLLLPAWLRFSGRGAVVTSRGAKPAL